MESETFHFEIRVSTSLYNLNKFMQHKNQNHKQKSPHPQSELETFETNNGSKF